MTLTLNVTQVWFNWILIKSLLAGSIPKYEKRTAFEDSLLVGRRARIISTS